MGVFDMNRSVIIGAIVVLLAAVGYYQFSYRPAQEQTMIEEAAAKAAEAAAAAEATAAEAAATVAAEAEAAAAAVTEAATAATEAVTEGATAATEAATDAVAGAMAALDPANFNADTVVGLIDGSTLDDAAKTKLKTAVDSARANPALVADTIALVKTALGM